jgi:cyclophilin family peptidyl-prolyl cis-trans isomerase
MGPGRTGGIMRAFVNFIALAASVMSFAAHGQSVGPAPGPSSAAAIAAAPMPQAKIETAFGTITIALDRANARKSVANFITYARAGHYDGTTIYRVAPGFLIQMGSYEPNGTARPVRAPVALETANGLRNVRGAVALARHDEPTSATAEFFIDLTDLPDLDAKPGAPPNTTGYAVFGRVIDGMDVAEKIAAVPTGGKGPFPPSATPLSPVLIRKVTITDPPATNPPPSVH